MNVSIEIVEHKSQRYPTVGDWYFDGEKNLVIRVSKMGDWRSEMLVAVHELVEVILCMENGIGEAIVDTFDQTHLDSDEPGDEPDAPYRDEHCFAMAVERTLCAAMKMSWKEHDQRVANAGE